MDKKLTIGMIITFVLAISGTYYLAQDDDAYYCKSRDIVMICEKISSGIGTRCYYEDTYKICNGGWIKFEGEQSIGNFTDFVCGDETFIKECVNQEGKVILRIKNE